MDTLSMVVFAIILRFQKIHGSKCNSSAKGGNFINDTSNVPSDAMFSGISSIRPVVTSSESLINSNVTEEISSTTQLTLQVLLAVFVLISTVSIVLNIIFLINMQRKNALSFGFELCKTKVNRTLQPSTTTVINNGNGFIQCNGKKTVPESYTELEIENLASGSASNSDNQYDSLTHQDNYINVTKNFP